MQKIEKENSIAIENERGITLIALVVTIVVTMILAGIAVKSGFGNKGLVKEARDTQANIEQAQQEGLQQIEDLKKDEKTIEDGVLTSEDNTAPTINEMTISKITKDSITVNISVTEEESGIDTIIYTATNGTDTVTSEVTTEREYKFKDLKSNTTYQIKVVVTDVAGNMTEKTESAKTL